MPATVESFTLDENATGNTIVLPQPTGLAEGDLLLAFLANDIDEVAGGWVDSANTWDEVALDVNGIARLSSVTIRSRIATSSEPSDYTFTLPGATDQNSGLLLRISGQADPWADTVTAFAERGNDATPASVNFTPTADGCLVLQVMFSVQANAITASGAPSGYDGQVSGTAPSTGADQPLISIAYLLQTTAAATGTADWWVGNTSATVDSQVIGIAVASAAGGTQFDVGLTGTTTSDATLARQTAKAITGATTSAGALTRQARRAVPLGGSDLDPTGVLTRRTARALAGSVALAGALATSKVAILALVGAVSSAAVLTRRPGKALTGAVSSAGVLTRRPARALTGAVSSAATLARHTAKTASGAVASAGTLATEVGSGLKLLAVAGAVAISSVLARQPRRTLAAALAPVGAVAREARRALAGTVAPTGTVARVKVALIALAGFLAPAGALTRQSRRTLTGDLSPVGGIAKRAARQLVGVVSWSATLAAVLGGTPTGWAWSIRRGGVWVPAAPTLDGSTTTTTVT